MTVAEVYDNATSQGTTTTNTDPITPSDSHIYVKDVASSALQAGKFRIIVFDPTSGTWEYMMVTSGGATNVWQVDRNIESSIGAKSFPVGCIVRHVFTAGAILGLVAGLSGASGVNVKDPQFAGGALGNGVHDDLAAIQAAIDYVTATGPAGRIWFPRGTYKISASLLITFGTQMYSDSPFATFIVADNTVPIANYKGGSRTQGAGVAAMVKWNGGDPWAHGVHVCNFNFDTNNIPGLSATWLEAPGECFMLDNLRCSNTVGVPRTLTDGILTAGSNVLSFASSTLTEEDVNAVLQFGGLVAPPAAPTCSGSGSGSQLAAGIYTVGVTYFTSDGETAVSVTTDVTITAGQNIVITSPAARTGATGWFAYVSQVGGGAIMFRQQSTATAIGTNLTLNAVTSTGATPYKKIDRINWAANERATTKTSCIMNNPATASQSGVHVTVVRPTDAFIFDMELGGAATGRIGILNGVKNSGALLRFKALGSGTFKIDELSGDDNQGGIFRCSRGAINADPAHITIDHVKSESDYYDPNWMWAHDPAILLDRCFTLALNILGGSFIASGYGRDVIRLDNSFVGGFSGPSIFLAGVEGQNWYNPPYVNNIIHDSSTGEAIPINQYVGNSYPNIAWGRDIKLGGGSRIPLTEKHRVSSVLIDPDWESSAGLWIFVAGYQYFHSLAWYNFNGALNDAGAWNVDLDTGTWELTVLGLTGANEAIVSVDYAINALVAPTAPGLQANSVGGGGYVSGSPNTPAGTYQVKVTFVTQEGYETTPSPAVSGIVDGTTQFQINAPPAVENAHGYNVYVTQAGGSTFTKQNSSPVGLVDVYKIFGAPTSTGAAPPTVNGSIFWSSVQGTFDQYLAGASQQSKWKVPGIVIPAHIGPVLVRFRATGKNAGNVASPGYYMNLSGMEWKKIG